MPDGALQMLLLVVILLLVAAGLFMAARRRSGVLADGARGTQEMTWNGTFSGAFQRVLDILGILEAQVVAADPNRGVIQARTSAGLGPSAIIDVEIRTSEGVTVVCVSSKSRRGRAEFLEIWDRLTITDEPAST
jgi:hypothetical protein